MNQNAPFVAESRLRTSRGDVRVRSFCSLEEIRRHHFDAEFGIHAQFKSLYTRRDSLESDALRPDANVVVALSTANHIIGFAVLAYPDPGERWLDLGPGLMMELRVIEVCRSWRSGKLAHELLRMALDHPLIEDKIAYMVGYSWTWDLDGTARRAQAYRQILIRLFEAHGFSEYETNEPNICLRQENIFMCRVGRRVPPEVVDRFNWLRFGIAPEPEGAAVAVHHPDRGEEKRQSLFYLLKEEGLTFLDIRHNWREDYCVLTAAAEWDGLVEWEDYNRRFFIEHPLMSGTRYLGHDQTLDLFDRHGLRDYLDQLLELIRETRHVGLECYLEPRRDLRAIHFMHSSALARGSVYRARRCGRVNRFDRRTAESAILARELNLGRLTSFRNAAAGLTFGGARIAIMSGDLEPSDAASLGFVAYVLDRTRSVVGPGKGLPASVVDAIRRGAMSTSITGRRDIWDDVVVRATAYAVFLALKAAAAVKFGDPRLTGRKVVVQGAGAVAAALVTAYLLPEGVHVFTDGTRPSASMGPALSGVEPVQTIDPEDVTGFGGDILVTCSGDGIRDDGAIQRMRYAVVLDAACPPSVAGGRKEEIRLAEKMAQRGILYLAEWIYNNADMIAVVDDYLHPEGINLERVMGQVARACPQVLRDTLEDARRNGATPTEQAYAHFDPMIYP